MIELVKKNVAQINNIEYCQSPNVPIADLGKEDVSYMTRDFVKKCFNTVMQSGLGILKFVQETHMNPEHPENHNIRAHTNSKRIMVMREGKWVLDDARLVAKEVAELAKERLGNYSHILCDHDTSNDARDEADNLLLDFQMISKKIASLKHGSLMYYDIIKRLICLFEDNLEIYNKRTNMPPETVSLHANNEASVTPNIDDNCAQPKKKYQKPKQIIPKTLKNAVWIKYIGETIAISPCLCCNSQTISQLSFHCGHIVSEACGGTIHIDNLRPICQCCNQSMGTINMNVFQQRHFGKSPDVQMHDV